MTFARHETFAFRDGWLAKGIHAVAADPDALNRDDAHHDLGLGTNMLKSVKYWIQATGHASATAVGENPRIPGLVLTDLGARTFWQDPYFESPQTLWLTHIELASNIELASSWYWFFNSNPLQGFTVEQIETELLAWSGEHAVSPPKPSSVKRDVQCLLKTYTGRELIQRRAGDIDPIGCPLADLGLITRMGGTSRYLINTGRHASITRELFLYVMHRFVEQRESESRVVSLDDLRWAPLSPGRLLALDTDAIRGLIAESESKFGSKHITEIRTAGLDLVQLGDADAEHYINLILPVEGEVAVAGK